MRLQRQTQTKAITKTVFTPDIASELNNYTKKSMNFLVHRLLLFVKESIVPLSAMLSYGSKTISL